MNIPEFEIIEQSEYNYKVYELFAGRLTQISRKFCCKQSAAAQLKKIVDNRELVEYMVNGEIIGFKSAIDHEKMIIKNDQWLYKCPGCHKYVIQREFNFCHSCGVEVLF